MSLNKYFYLLLSILIFSCGKKNGENPKGSSHSYKEPPQIFHPDSCTNISSDSIQQWCTANLTKNTGDITKENTLTLLGALHHTITNKQRENLTVGKFFSSVKNPDKYIVFILTGIECTFANNPYVIILCINKKEGIIEKCRAYTSYYNKEFKSCPGTPLLFSDKFEFERFGNYYSMILYQLEYENELSYHLIFNDSLNEIGQLHRSSSHKQDGELIDYTQHNYTFNGDTVIIDHFKGEDLLIEKKKAEADIIYLCKNDTIACKDTQQLKLIDEYEGSWDVRYIYK